VLGVPEPGEPERYCFERGLVQTGGSGARTDGFADVWLRGHFGWEYKAPGGKLGPALRQLMMYALALDNPPLLVVSDRHTLEIHTHFTGTPSERHVVQLAEVTRPEVQHLLRRLWTDPDSFRPRRSNREITEDAARSFAATAKRLRDAGVAAERVSHFLTQCVFCFFAEDVGLLPARLLERLVAARATPQALQAQLQRLFEAMRSGGLFGVDAVPWFNGGLFAAIDVPPLAPDDVDALRAASTLDWSAIDPACGSGNFLYLALKCLKDIEHQVNLDAEALGLPRQHDVTGPHNVRGIELDEYAAELARVTVWIGELQWRVQRGYGFRTDPVLRPLDQIETRDAVLGPDGKPAAWPQADAVVGNPPFVGDKKMRGELGHAYTEALRAACQGRVPGGADLVCCWFEQARAQIEAGHLQRAGLVATNSIRGGANRAVLDRIVQSTRIFEAWSDEPWVNEGAAVRVSLVAFGASDQAPMLDGTPASRIAADLNSGERAGDAVDLTAATRLPRNGDTSFSGIQKTGPFEIPGDTARAWLRLPNPHGRPNSDVVRPWWNGLDVTRRNRDMWIADFGADMRSDDAALYEAPFAYVTEHVKPTRVGKREARTNECYWLFQWSRPVLRQAIAALPRFIATPEVAKHRCFVWLDRAVIADKNLVVIARADDTSFGVLHSRLHELWSLRLCTWLGKGNDPRYTPTTTFETFPFPAGLTPADTAHQRTEALPDGAVIPAELPAAVRPHAEAIARAAKALVDLRERWLNPPEWTERVPELVPLGMATSPYPERIVAKPGHAHDLAQRPLTKLYNQRPTWLAHAALDAAVAAACGWADWTPAMADDGILRRLLALNRARAGT